MPPAAPGGRCSIAAQHSTARQHEGGWADTLRRMCLTIRLSDTVVVSAGAAGQAARKRRRKPQFFGRPPLGTARDQPKCRSPYTLLRRGLNGAQ